MAKKYNVHRTHAFNKTYLQNEDMKFKKKLNVCIYFHLKKTPHLHARN